MTLNGKEVYTRHCPRCGEVVNKLYYEMDIIEYGSISYNDSISNTDDVQLDYDDSERNKSGKTYFICSKCYQTVTEDIEEAKEFMTLKNESTG